MVEVRRAVVVAAVALVAAFALLAPTAGAATGAIKEYAIPTANANPQKIATGPDGNLWFTEIGANKVGRITPAGEITEFTLPTPDSNPFWIAPGPDGNVWITEATGNRIGRITPTGQITEFPLPRPKSFPAAITPGPDGAMWFTESSGGRIARITTAGAITEYPPLPSGHSPYGITAGPDGKIWFTNDASATQSIERLDPATGAVTNFPFGTTSRTPDTIVPGPDGNLWFTTRGGHVAKITPAGALTFYSSSAGANSGIVTGSDGALWFDVNPNNAIGRVTTNGSVTQFPASGTFPTGIAAGPDGNVWFTESFPNRIGRLQIVKPSTRDVLSLDSGFVPATVTASQGTTIQWSFYGPRVHRVADSSGMSLFDSGPKSVVSFFSTKLNAAGTYRYADPANPALAGKVQVSVAATPAGGGTGTSFAIKWAAAAPASGRVFDVQVQRPGSAAYVTWKQGVTATGASFVPDAGPGTYRFRSRLRSSSSGKAIGYSPGKAITVSGP